MQCRRLATTALAATAACVGSTASPDPLRERLGKLDEIVVKGLAEQRYPGAVLVVGVGGKRLWSKAYGRHTYDATSPRVTLRTIFDMASVTKVAATTPAAMLLVEDGKIGLDEPVARYLPGFEAKTKGGVRVRDLLAHVSGLKAYESFPVVEKARRPDETHAQALWRHYCELPLAYPTGTKMVYSCLNLQTMAAVLQTVSAESTEELMRRRMWGPMGMRDTTFRPTPAQVARCAPTGVGPDGVPIRGAVHDPLALYHGSTGVCPGNAGLFSTAGDLERYVRMTLGRGRFGRRRMLREDTVGAMTTVQTAPELSPRGLGWGLYTSPPQGRPGGAAQGEFTVGHTGYTGTWMWMDSASGAYAIFLTNRVFPSPAQKGGEGAAIDGIRGRIAQTVLEAVGAIASADRASRPAGGRD